MSRSERLLGLVQILRRQRQPVSAESLAEELAVSVRSIYRDVQTLRGQGALINGEAGVGYVLRPGFLLPPLMFSDEEVEALVLGLRLASEHGDSALGRAALDVVAKLRDVLPKELRTFLDEVSLLAGPALSQPPETVDLVAIRRTIREQRKARIEYTDKNGVKSTRVIWPLGLAFFERARIVIAWCEQRPDFCSFRTDQMASFTPMPARIERSRMALLRQWRNREGIFAQLPG